jgi:hypothetical protein
MRNPLIRAFRTANGRWHGEPGDPATIDHCVVLPFFPNRMSGGPISPYAGQDLLIAVGESRTPPGWTRFVLPPGTYYATSVVCWLLFGAGEPDQWPLSRHEERGGR